MARRRGSKTARWFGFFFGTPRRFLVTALAVTTLALIHHFSPGTITNVVHGLVGELSPLLNMLFYYGLVFFFLMLGYKLLLKPFFGKK